MSYVVANDALSLYSGLDQLEGDMCTTSTSTS